MFTKTEILRENTYNERDVKRERLERDGYKQRTDFNIKIKERNGLILQP
jgi:hypothetical protein